jgi:hypothetical protein
MARVRVLTHVNRSRGGVIAVATSHGVDMRRDLRRTTLPGSDEEGRS